MCRFSYTTAGTCASKIEFNLDNGIVSGVEFTRGCNGNTQGIARLVEGMEVKQVIAALKGVNCNGRGTSCPDQLARALEAALEAQK